jgi:hypothetical protein
MLANLPDRHEGDEQGKAGGLPDKAHLLSHRDSLEAGNVCRSERLRRLIRGALRSLDE